jgi:hypothetical protein
MIIIIYAFEFENSCGNLVAVAHTGVGDELTCQ